MTQRYSYIAMGANLQSSVGSPLQTLQQAVALMQHESLSITRCSQWYHTPAFPAGSGPDFVNAVVEIVTDLAAADVLAALHRIEEQLGRVRLHRWGARVCDLDLIDHAGLVAPDIATWRHWHGLAPDEQASQAPAELILPHPRIQDRGFVLVPLAEIAPDWRHPVTGQTAAALRDSLPVEEIEQIRAISGA